MSEGSCSGGTVRFPLNLVPWANCYVTARTIVIRVCLGVRGWMIAQRDDTIRRKRRLRALIGSDGWSRGTDRRWKEEKQREQTTTERRRSVDCCSKLSVRVARSRKENEKTKPTARICVTGVQAHVAGSGQRLPPLVYRDQCSMQRWRDGRTNSFARCQLSLHERTCLLVDKWNTPCAIYAVYGSPVVSGNWLQLSWLSQSYPFLSLVYQIAELCTCF